VRWTQNGVVSPASQRSNDRLGATSGFHYIGSESSENQRPTQHGGKERGKSGLLGFASASPNLHYSLPRCPSLMYISLSQPDSVLRIQVVGEKVRTSIFAVISR
jgi:hypothetical protein